jgi:hypothetical protein
MGVRSLGERHRPPGGPSRTGRVAASMDSAKSNAVRFSSSYQTAVLCTARDPIERERQDGARLAPLVAHAPEQRDILELFGAHDLVRPRGEGRGRVRGSHHDHLSHYQLLARSPESGAEPHRFSAARTIAKRSSVPLRAVDVKQDGARSLDPQLNWFESLTNSDGVSTEGMRA